LEARIIGLKGVGKSTLLTALAEGRAGGQVASVKVGDERIRVLSGIFKPKKTVFAEFQVREAVWPEATGRKGEMERYLNAVAGAQLFLHVLRGFASPALAEAPDPARDLLELDHEFILADLLAVERAYERANKQPFTAVGKSVMARVREALEAETPVRELALEPEEAAYIRSYAFLTQTPQLLLVNLTSGGEAQPALPPELARDRRVVAFPFDEALEVARLPIEEQLEFAQALGLPGPAADLVTQAAFAQMGLISFFTVGEDEVRAWPIRAGESARQAAGAVHSDIERGFIRAEVLSYEEFMDQGSLKAAREHGVLRVEGKDYPVKDGDIIHYRFNI
jgi:ribosome-binding ATPase YchF (GTP1/OBG family)